MRNVQKLIIALLLCIVLLMTALPVAAAEGKAYSGVFESYTAETHELIRQDEWTLDLQERSLTVQYRYFRSTDAYGRIAPDWDEIVPALAEQTGLSIAQIVESVETLRYVGYDTIRGYTGILFPNLRTIEFGSVSVITDDPFADQPIRELVIPGSVKTVDGFTHCTELQSVVLEEGVDQIGCQAFYECEALTHVDIPDSVKRIGLEAFHKTPWLETRTEEFVIVGDGVLIRYNGTNQTEITVPDSVKSVCCTLGWRDFETQGVYTYARERMTNPNLRKVTFPGSVREIHAACYSLPELTEVVLNEGVTYIGPYAFFNCEKLKTVVVPASVTRLNWIGTFGAYSTDIEGHEDLIDPDCGWDTDPLHPWRESPTVIFRGEPPKRTPEQPNVMLHPGETDSLTFWRYELPAGVLWHLRYHPKYTETWERFTADVSASRTHKLIDRLTFAEQYEPLPYLPNGDANLSGDVTAADAVLILRHIVEIELLSGKAKTLADVNGDGRITAGDAAMILRWLVGLIPSL